MFTFFSISNGDPVENKKAQDLHKFDEVGLPRTVSFYTHKENCSLVNGVLGTGAESRDVRSFISSATKEETAVKRVLFEDLEEEEEIKKALHDGQVESVRNKLFHGTGEFYKTDHGFYILMKKLPSKTLSQLYFEGKNIISDYSEFLQLFTSITHEVKKLHDNKLSHGDLHGGNILVDAKNLRSTLCDFNKTKLNNRNTQADDVYEVGSLILRFASLRKLDALSAEEKTKLQQLAKMMCDEDRTQRIPITKVHQFFVDELEKCNKKNITNSLGLH